MVDDDVEEDPHVATMGGVDEVDQVLLRAEARVDIQIILDAIAVKTVWIRDILEDRAEPDRRAAEIEDVVEVVLHSAKRAAAKRVFRAAAPRPRSRRGWRARAVVVEPVDQQKIDELL